jgi:hypothetical protein
MSDFELNPEWDAIETQAPMDDLPEIEYFLEVIECSGEFVEAAGGQRIKMTYKIMEGLHEGRQGWDKFDRQRLVEWNDKKTGERRSAYLDEVKFKSLCVAIGMNDHPSNYADFYGIPFRAKLKYTTSSDGKRFQQWSNFKPANAAPPQQQQRQSVPQAQQARPVATARPAPASTGGKPSAWPSRSTPGQTAFGR